jgi:NhaP-type Na+/H+ or K+/H+ antiporter
VEQNEPTKAMASYLMTQCVLGCVIGLVWGLLILATDTAGIRDLLSASSYPAATFLLFLLGSIIAILPVVLATAIGRLAE